ncbi:ClpP/crotonase-like domain-containing protein [Infundibulicybe gibba]|nr:ClpP/crotonase-like domain-containing protein [Infundibulicybe gibba]
MFFMLSSPVCRASIKWANFNQILGSAPANAFNTDNGHLFERLAQEAEDIRAVVVSSSIPKMFTAGLDLNTAAPSLGESREGMMVPDPPSHGRVLLEFQHAIGSPERCPFPVIAATHGHTLEVDIGLAADVGSLAFLPKLPATIHLSGNLHTGGRFQLKKQRDWSGVQSHNGGRDEVVKAALDLAKLIATKSPVAVASSKRLITHSRDHTVAENLEYTSAWNSAALMTNVC